MQGLRNSGAFFVKSLPLSFVARFAQSTSVMRLCFAFGTRRTNGIVSASVIWATFASWVQNPSMPFVFRTCDPLQILDSVIRFVSVSVVDLMSIARRWPNKRRCNQSVNRVVLTSSLHSACARTGPQIGSQISVPNWIGVQDTSNTSFITNDGVVITFDWPPDFGGILKLHRTLLRAVSRCGWFQPRRSISMPIISGAVS